MLDYRALWLRAHATGERFVPRYPVKPCPDCGNEPVFIRMIGDGKWGKITWVAIDFCGTNVVWDNEYIGSTIRYWQEHAHQRARELAKAPPVESTPEPEPEPTPEAVKDTSLWQRFKAWFIVDKRD